MCEYLRLCKDPPWRRMCDASVKRTFSGLSPSDKADADVPDRSVQFACQTSAGNHAARGGRWSGPEKPTTYTFISLLQHALCTSIRCHCDLPQNETGLLSPDLWKLPFSQSLRSSWSSLMWTWVVIWKRKKRTMPPELLLYLFPLCRKWFYPMA